MHRLLCLAAVLAACDDSSSGPVDPLSVDFVEPRSRAVLSCAADEEPGTPATVEFDVTLLVDGATPDLTLRLLVEPGGVAPRVRPVREDGIVRFEAVPLPRGDLTLRAELWRGDPPGGGPVSDAGPDGCAVGPGQCPNLCEHGIGVEGELCQRTADCACGLFCKAETQACAPYEGSNAGCACGAVAGSGAAQPLTAANIGVTVETCGGLPIDAGGGDSEPPVDALTPDGALPDARIDPDAAQLDVGPPPDGAPPMDMAVEADARPPGDGQYGDLCRCGADCASGFCVENKLRAARTCTDRCQNDNFCPGIDTCVEVMLSGPTPECPDINPDGPQPGDQVGVCIPNETGFPCDGPRGCSLGICLDPPRPANWIQAQAVCTVICQDDRRCPHGFRCDRAGGDVGGNICVPDVEVAGCTSWDQCGGVCDPSTAETTVCIQRQEDGPNGQGYCSCTCASAADCPTGYACDAVALESGDARRPGICVLMAGYRCPAPGQAEQAAQCPSMTCAHDPEAPADARCTAFCRNEADCPRNHACRDVGGVGACLPRE